MAALDEELTRRDRWVMSVCAKTGHSLRVRVSGIVAVENITLNELTRL
jgi:hypothetical protein